MPNKYECTNIKKVAVGEAKAVAYRYSFKPVGEAHYFTSEGGALSFLSVSPGLFSVGQCYNLSFGGEDQE